MSKKLNPSILIIEDEESVSGIIRYNLKKEGYQVLSTDDGAEGLELAKQHKPDLILLDWMLPSLSGIEVCKSIRSTEGVENIPIIMISARNEEMDKVMGLERGADDYISKPFSPAELIARIRAILRRLRPAFAGKAMVYEDIVMDMDKYLVTRGGKPVRLSPIEFRILQLLMEHPGRVLSRDALMDKIWGTELFVGSRTIDVHITRLRKCLLEASSDGIDVISTVRLTGYTLRSGKEETKDTDQ
jgi:two-component system, OmpR family, phosphate regulon response regulator PhoB